ncbi:MAG TPA: hypothetical protein PKV66_05170 [Candidatus Pelethenecus sp.]|nr:hypothetical protein [Candidatus Pelethenecus sp.]
MEEILKKIDDHSLELYLIAGDLLIKSNNTEDEDEKYEILNASEVLQQMSTALKTIWSELKEIA